ncbi:MAG: helix-turn-helix transcriptional regulator [Pseudonocardia sp.]|nr:helix-turn-helix transcriptional regulator [Pseudonocardia sp.]
MSEGTGPTADDWKRLGKAIEDRRFERGLSQEQLVKRGGPSHQTVRNIERGLVADYRPTTFRKLDRALDWLDGTSEKILRGTATEDDIAGVWVRAGSGDERVQITPDGRPLGRVVDAGPIPGAELADDVRALMQRLATEPWVPGTSEAVIALVRLLGELEGSERG